MVSAGNKYQIYGTLMCSGSKSQPPLCMLLLSYTQNLVPELWMDHSLTPNQGSCQLQQPKKAFFRSPGVPQSVQMHQAFCSPFTISSPTSFLSHTGCHCYCISDRAAPSFRSFPVNNSQIQSILHSLKGVFPGQPHCYNQHRHKLILRVPQKDSFCLGHLCV